MILDSSLRLEAVLSGAVSANQPEAKVDYVVWNNDGTSTKPLLFRSALNSTTDVTILAAPTTTGYVREIKRVSIYNKDTATATVTVKTDDGTTERIICRVSLATRETLNFEAGAGWYVTAANGARKQSSGVSGPASSTDNGLVRWDGTTGTLVKDSSGATYDGTTFNVTSSGGIALKSSQLQMFFVQITNTAGTLQHRIASDASLGTLGTWTNKINAASTTLQNTPNGTDGSTAFTTGVKISSGDLTKIYFDTADQVTADAFLMATIVLNDTGTAYTLSQRFGSININGVTRNRPSIRLLTGTAGASTNWDTTAIPSGKSILMQCFGILA